LLRIIVIGGSDVFKIDQGREVDHRLMLGEETGSFLHNPFPIALAQPIDLNIIGMGSEKRLHRLSFCFRPHGVLVVIHQLDLECDVHECRVRPEADHFEVETQIADGGRRVRGMVVCGIGAFFRRRSCCG
jgi:hypothetical protein